MGGDAPAQGRAADPGDPGYRADCARDGGRPREGHGGRLRRLRYKTGRAAPTIAEDRGAACSRWRAVVSGGRFEHAIAAFLRQEFGASVAAIIGFVDILIEDARRPDLADCLADLQRMREAGVQLSALIEQAVASGAASDASLRTHLRHELRTPLNAIKGYGELLVEEVSERGRNTSLADLEKVLGLADRLLGEIDRMVEVSAAPPTDIVGNVLQSIRPLGEADLADPAAVASRILVGDDNAEN